MYYYVLDCKHRFSDAYPYRIGETVFCDVTWCGKRKVSKEDSNAETH
jgi:hypothetical protein